MRQIQNPILPGFHPDPSICRVENDFYIATSTFEWFPGVMIYHSRDLIHWTLIARPLDRLDLLDMRGEAPSCGVWAPCLTHDGENFHLVYSDTKEKAGPFWDVSNYVTTAPDITGPWSERVFLNRCGFDPSMFHDEDGRKWVVTVSQDRRPGANRFGGIELQEYDPGRKRLVGEPEIIFTGTDLRCCEGAHLYKHRDMYYLMVAEGGTGWRHAVTLARSSSIHGPYEVDPEYPMLTSYQDEASVLQKAGHASLVQVTEEEWALVHLCSRPISEQRRCLLGRETAIQPVEWSEDGWLRLKGGGRRPRVTFPAFSLPEVPTEPVPETVPFSPEGLPLEFQTLREPLDESWASLTERPGWLRLRGRYSLYSNFEQSLVGRRIQHFRCEGKTLIDYDPVHHQQAAGLIAFYDDLSFYALQITWNEGRVLRLTCSEEKKETYPVPELPLPEGPIRLRMRIDHDLLRCAWATESGEWNDLGVALDATVLSDDFGSRMRFTGPFFCLQAQDKTLFSTPADFQSFTYRTLNA